MNTPAHKPVSVLAILSDEEKKIAEHKRMYKDTSIAAPYAHNPLHVPAKLTLTKKTANMQCICSYTGIVIEIEVPLIEGYAFEYQNPLSIYANVKGILSKGVPYLKQLDTQVLAGLYLTAYRHYDLLEPYSPKAKFSGAQCNALLRSAGKDILIESLSLIDCVNSRNCLKLPSLSLEYTAHKNARDMGPAIKEYTKTLRAHIFPDSIQDKRLRDVIEEKTTYESIEAERKSSDRRGTGTIKAYVGPNRRSSILSDREQEFEESFKRNKKLFKTLVSDLEEQELFSPKVAKVLKQFVTGSNLKLMAANMRKKLIAKLEEKPCDTTNALIKVIQDTENPYDIFASVDLEEPAKAEEVVKEIEVAVESKVSAPAKVSPADRLAAILAAKKLANQQKKEDNGSDI